MDENLGGSSSEFLLSLPSRRLGLQCPEGSPGAAEAASMMAHSHSCRLEASGFCCLWEEGLHSSPHGLYQRAA